ncbi:MAG TPA: hypothetical protein VN667_14670 [Burkholderiales bacterium]|nr:hypothetical protein [Burkholderiales bacterium]
MRLARTYEQARQDMKSFATETFWGDVCTYFQEFGGKRPSPQAFTVEQGAKAVLDTHFHRQHQFQVVFRGAGLLGRHPLAPFTIHYASPESGYGPVVAGDSGLAYLTLRAVSEEGSQFLPAMRDSMRKGLAKRQMTLSVPALSDPNALAALASPRIEDIIVPDDSGLAAWLARLPAHARLPMPMTPQRGGTFCVAAQGSMLIDGKDMPTLSTAFISADEPEATLAAGAGGLEVLVLQFPAAAIAAPEAA